jgi:hypothetical protein
MADIKARKQFLSAYDKKRLQIEKIEQKLAQKGRITENEEIRLEKYRSEFRS